MQAGGVHRQSPQQGTPSRADGVLDSMDEQGEAALTDSGAGAREVGPLSSRKGSDNQ